MGFTPETVSSWVKRHKFFAALVVVLVFGYAIGKDMALGDNAAERQAAEEVE